MSARVNSKEKGSTNEREICKVLSLWWSRGASNSVFVRTGGSGSMGTMRKNNVDQLYGDIMAIDEIGRPFTKLFSIELKKGYDLRNKYTLENGKVHQEIIRYDLLDMLDSGQETATILKFWEQCCHDAEQSNRKPLLIFQRYRRQPLLVYKHPKTLFNTYLSLTHNRNLPHGVIHHYKFNIMLLSEFLNIVDPDLIRTYIDETI